MAAITPRTILRANVWDIIFITMLKIIF
jgi:hypothetical protein